MVFQVLGADVKYWFSMNEQSTMVHYGATSNLFPVDISTFEKEKFVYNHHFNLANAKAILACRELLPVVKIGPTWQLIFWTK